MQQKKTSAEKWVLIRGLMRESRHWGELPLKIQQAKMAGQVIALDLPGNGARFQETSPISIARMVQSARQQLLDQQLSPPYALLAISLGGMLAMEWLQLFPEELQSVVLMNSSVRGLSPFYHRLQPAAISQIPALLYYSGSPFHKERCILELTSNYTRKREDVYANWVQYATSHPVSRRNALHQLWAAAHYIVPEYLPQEKVLVLRSLGDRLVHPDCSLHLAQRFGWSLQSHPSAGHDLSLDDPEWVLAQINQWLNTL